MKYLAIDLGDARTGIAVSESGIIATGLETYRRINEEKDCGPRKILQNRRGCFRSSS
jgi:RNase H-fold protein (predicted Holliday junction resolvase)